MKKKNLVRASSYDFHVFENKVKLKDRPKCLQCDKSIPFRRAWERDADMRWKRSETFVLSGEGFFCCRYCALAFADKAARKLLKIDKFNEKN